MLTQEQNAETMDMFAVSSLETMLADKYVAILRRNIDAAQVQDYYDLYMLVQQHHNEIRPDILRKAVVQAAEKNGSTGALADWKDTLRNIREEPQLYTLWRSYTAEHNLIADVPFHQILDAVDLITQMLDF